MPAKTDLINGALKVTGLLEDLCIESLQELIQTLPQLLSVQIPASITNVTIGPEQPGDSERQNLWIRTDNSSDFVGIYIYALGQWRQVYPVPGQLFRIVGDSRTPPKGFTLATDSPSLSAAQKTWIVSQWLPNSTNEYYTIFDVVYSGF